MQYSYIADGLAAHVLYMKACPHASHEESSSVETVYDLWQLNKSFRFVIPDLTLGDPTLRHGVGSNLSDSLTLSPPSSHTHNCTLYLPALAQSPPPVPASPSLEACCLPSKTRLFASRTHALTPLRAYARESRTHALVAALSLFFLLSKIASSSSAFFSNTPLYTCF